MTPLASIPVLLETGAVGSTFDITSTMQSAVTSTQNQIFSVLGIVVPAIVAVTAAIVAVKFGVGWLRKIKGN